MAEKPVEPSRRNWIEPVAAVLMALTTLCTAWYLYQPAAWTRRSTGTKDPKTSDILYIRALAAPFTVNTMREGTLKALRENTELGSIRAAEGGNCEEVLAQFAQARVDVDVLAAQLQEGVKSFVKSWNELMSVIASKSDALKQVA